MSDHRGPMSTSSSADVRGLASTQPIIQAFQPVIRKGQPISFFVSFFKSIKNLAVIFKVYRSVGTYTTCS